MTRREPDIAELKHLYLYEGLSTSALAERFGMSSGTVWARLKAAGVEFRKRGVQPRLDSDDLRRWYVDERLSTIDIARKTGMSTTGVTAALERAGIPRRPLNGSELPIDDAILAQLYVEQRRSVAEIAEQYQVAPWAVTRRLRAGEIHRQPGRPAGAHVDRPTRTELHELYVTQHRSMSDIAARFGVPDPTVRRWLEQAQIRLRRPSEVQGLRPGGSPAMTRERLMQWYVTEQRTAQQIAAELGVTRRIVISALHSLRIPVRPSGPSSDPPVVLLDALYADRRIAAALRRHGIPARPDAGMLRERWPDPVDPPVEALQELYSEIGLSVFHISLLTGLQPAGIRHRLQSASVPSRGSGRAPWQPPRGGR